MLEFGILIQKKVLSTEKILSSFSKSVHGDSLGIDWSTNERLAVTSGTQGEVSIYSINSNNHLKSEFSFQNNDQTIVSNIKLSRCSSWNYVVSFVIYVY